MSFVRCIIRVVPIALLSSFGLSGCGFYLPSQLVKPEEVRLETAMRDVGKSLVGLNQQLKDSGYRSGLIPDEVEVVFNVSASANESDKLTLSAGQPQKAGAFLLTNLNNEFSIASEAKRGNQITIKLKSLYTIQPNSIATADLGLTGNRPKICLDARGRHVTCVTNQSLEPPRF